MAATTQTVVTLTPAGTMTKRADVQLTQALTPMTTPVSFPMLTPMLASTLTPLLLQTLPPLLALMAMREATTVVALMAGALQRSHGLTARRRMAIRTLWNGSRCDTHAASSQGL